MLDLESDGSDASVAEEIEDECAVVVADSNALCQTLVDKLFHGLPGLGKACFGWGDLVVFIGPARRVANGGVDVFESDGEVHNVQVEVVDAPIFELLLGDWLYALAVVE